MNEYIAVYRLYNNIDIAHFHTFSQYINWQFALLELNKRDDDYIPFEIMQIKEVKIYE
jgi:hypothetical protein